MDRAMKKFDDAMEKMDEDMDAAFGKLDRAFDRLNDLDDINLVERNYPMRKKKEKKKAKRPPKPIPPPNRVVGKSKTKPEHSLGDELSLMSGKWRYRDSQYNIFTATRDLKSPDEDFTPHLTDDTNPVVFKRSFMGRMFGSEILPPYCVEVDGKRIYMVMIEYQLKTGAWTGFFNDWTPTEMRFLKKIFESLVVLGMAKPYHLESIKIIDEILDSK